MQKIRNRQSIGKRNKQKGNAFELKIIKELIEIGYLGLKSSRSESKNLDNDKIDIAETTDRLPCYVQCKMTLATPNVEEIIKSCPRKDRPLAVFWNKQIKRENNMRSGGEYVLIEKNFFYDLIKKV